MISRIFNVSNVKHEFFNIDSLMKEILVTLQQGNVNRTIMLDDSIHKSLKAIKNNYSSLTYQTSQITTLLFAIEYLKHIKYVFKAYFDFIDAYFSDVQCNIKVKNRDIFDYCDSASSQINTYINNFHCERMKALCSY